MYLLLSRLAFCFQRKECNVWRVKKVCFSNWCFIFTRFECLSDRYTPHIPLVCSRLCFHPVQNYHKDTRFEYLSHWYTGHTPFSLYFHSAQSEHKTAKQHKTDQSGSQHLQWVEWKFSDLNIFPLHAISTCFEFLIFPCFEWVSER